MPNKDMQLFPENEEQLRRMLMDSSMRVKIYCRNIDERQDVLRALQKNGYRIGANTQPYIDESYSDFSYPFPGRGMGGDYIACYMNITSVHNWIDSEDVLAILCDPSTVFTPPTDTEFASALSALLG